MSWGDGTGAREKCGQPSISLFFLALDPGPVSSMHVHKQRKKYGVDVVRSQREFPRKVEIKERQEMTTKSCQSPISSGLNSNGSWFKEEKRTNTCIPRKSHFIQVVQW